MRPIAMVLGAAVAACSTSPLGPGGAPNLEFSASPAAVAPGGTVHLSLTNSSRTTIAAVPCFLALQRWDGSAWGAKPNGILCAGIEVTLAPGAHYDRTKTVDSSAEGGAYRAAIMVDLGRGPPAEVTSNTFTVMP